KGKLLLIHHKITSYLTSLPTQKRSNNQLVKLPKTKPKRPFDQDYKSMSSMLCIYREAVEGQTPLLPESDLVKDLSLTRNLIFRFFPGDDSQFSGDPLSKTLSGDLGATAAIAASTSQY
ncbi:hypothetical protein TorRG33x02_308490, partial [Trema orientale]